MSESKNLLSQLANAKDAVQEKELLQEWLELHPSQRSISIRKIGTEGKLEISFPEAESSIVWSPLDSENAQMLYLE